MNKSVTVLLLILISLFYEIALAQKASKREWTIFQKGVEDYQAGNYDLAEKNFATVLAKLKDSKLLTANYLMLAKTYYKKAEYNRALEQCQQFLNLFPNSTYVNDVYYLMAVCHYRMDQFEMALQNWFLSAEKNPESSLTKKALRLADETVRFRLDEQTLFNLKNNSKGNLASQAIMYLLAERFYEANKPEQAQSILDEMLRLNTTETVYTDKAEKLYNYLRNHKSNSLRIAALLPLSGTNAKVGQALLDGAKMALDEFNRAHGVSVELLPFDYETRLVTAVHQFRAIARDRTISAVFGPVEDDITSACAALAEYENIVIITPTASDDEIRQISNQVIQLATPVDVSAQRLARFASDSLHIHRLAVLAPLDDYFVRLTKSYIQRHRENDNQVAAELWYDAGQQDLSKYFKGLKKIGLDMALKDSTLSKDLPDLSVFMDSTDIPINTFEGIFLPVFRDDISMVSSQFAYSNIRAQVLGNSDWYDLEALRKNRNYINGMVLVSDGYLNEESWDYRQFRNNFRITYKRTPEKMELLGYDSFNFILSALPENLMLVNRLEFPGLMQKASNYNGIYRNFAVGQKRYNSSVRILKFLYGQIVPLN